MVVGGVGCWRAREMSDPKRRQLRVQAGHAGWLRPDETSLIDTPGPLTTSSGQYPPGIVVVQPHCDQPAQVDRGDPQRQAELVAGQAAIADPAVALGAQPGE